MHFPSLTNIIYEKEKSQCDRKFEAPFPVIHCAVSLYVRKWTSNHCSLFPSHPFPISALGSYECLCIFPAFPPCFYFLSQQILSANCGLMKGKWKRRWNVKLPKIFLQSIVFLNLCSQLQAHLFSHSCETQQVKIAVHTSSLTCFSL